MRRWMLWNLIVAVLAVSIVVLGVRADQAELRKDAMVHLYGVGTCKSVGMMATPDCTPSPVRRRVSSPLKTRTESSARMSNRIPVGECVPLWERGLNAYTSGMRTIIAQKWFIVRF
ncbi:hypothetical protein J7M22_00065 [Candidatus Poribacteria bacterium]|nr:hypothetical protein [Candidatus Poribacteria bacterium]